MSFEEITCKIVKIYRLPEGNRIKAFVDININDALIIKGLRVVDGKKGIFVSMPSEQGKNDRWYEKVRCINKKMKNEINRKVLEAIRK